MGRQNATHQKIERGGVHWPLMAVIEIINTTTNRKSERSAGRIFGRAWNCDGTCGGGVPPSFGVVNEATKRKLNAIGRCL